MMGGVARAGGGLAAGHLGLAPSLGTSFTPASPYTHSAGKFALLGLGSQAAWHSARLAAERGQQGGASGRGAEDVAGRPGHEQDPRPGARGPEGEGTLGGSRVSHGGGQAVQPGWEQASWEDIGWRRTMAVPGRQHAACLARPKPEVAAWDGGVVAACAWGLLRSSSHGVEPRLQSCSPAQEDQARQAGPRAVKEKNIPRPANCCSQLPPPTPPGGEKKKSSASSRGGCKRMQNFNHLLHQPGLLQAKFAGELGSDTMGKGLWRAHMTFL